MKKNKNLVYLFSILILLSGCKTIGEKTNEIKKNLGIKSTNSIETKDSIEITVSCGEDSQLKEYINEGWSIVKEHTEEKICSWKSVAATKNCNIEKDKGCKIIQPDIIGEEKIYLLEK